MKVDLSLINNVLMVLAKSVLVPIGLTAAALAADAGIHCKISGFRITANHVKWRKERPYGNR